MDGRGMGYCVMLGSFSVSPSVRLSVTGCGGDGKGRSCVLILDLVVIEKVSASGSGVSLFKRAEAELGELIDLPGVDPRYVVVKDLNHKPFLYPIMRHLFD
ncbi:hypothetical protein Tco_0453277 [Tanacetum coccineum]